MSKPVAKFNLTHLNLVAKWDIKSKTPDCALCRNPLVAPSPQEISNIKSKSVVDIDGKILKGKCGCMFHQDCIDKVLKNGTTFCPIDKTKWEISETIKTGVIYDGTQIAMKS